MKQKMKKILQMIRCQRGAVVMEATISLTAFMFFVVSVLSIINICTAQTKIGIALNETAKEISQYSYIYDLTGVNQIQSENYNRAEATRTDIGTVVNGVGGIYKAIGEIKSGDVEDGFHDMQSNAESVSQTVEKVVTSENKSEWVLGLLRIAANEGFDKIKGEVCGLIARGLMQKHLTDSSGGDVESYLRHLGIVPKGTYLDGIYMGDSVFFLNGSNDIILIADYEIKVIKLLDHDITLHFRQAAVTKAWCAVPLESGIVEAEEPGDENGGTPGGENNENPGDENGETPGDGEDKDGEQPKDDQDGDTSGAVPVEDESDPVRKQMVDEYGEGVIKEIEAIFDTTGWTTADWEHYIELYLLTDGFKEYEGNKIINGKIAGKIPLDDYLQIRKDSVHNGHSYRMILGRYDKDGIKYTDVAEDMNATYFSLGTDWDAIKKKYDLTDNDMFNIFNKPALNDAINSGKIIVFSHNPEAKENQGSALEKEWKYMQEVYGYNELVESNGVWYPK